MIYTDIYTLNIVIFQFAMLVYQMVTSTKSKHFSAPQKNQNPQFTEGTDSSRLNPLWADWRLVIKVKHAETTTLWEWLITFNDIK